ncbi:MAG: 4-hydroxybenzoate octaprenyltransferase [Alphaproteobacteria bacterium]|nr:4-hydroxybenzoate octaprenyltransferase [Alphaproteobacteria bacterium]
MSTENTKTHTDIKHNSWLVEKSPAALRPYVLLARLDRPIGIWLLLLPGWWTILLASGGFAFMGTGWRLLWLFALGAVLMRAAGCTINDLWDRNLDKNVERTRLRPLAFGVVNAKSAFVFLFILLLLSLLILLQMNVLTIALGFTSLPLIALYPLMKRITWWPQAFLGLTFNFGALMGWSAVSGSLGWPPVLIYMAGIFWTLGYDTIYAHQDKEDDMMVGIKSTALKFGHASKRWVGGFYAISWALLCAGVCVFVGNVLAIAMLLPAGAHLATQIVRWDSADPMSTLKTFKANRNYGLMVLLGIAGASLLL